MMEIATIWMDALRFADLSVVTVSSTQGTLWSNVMMVLSTTTPSPMLAVKTAVFLLAVMVLLTPLTTKLATALRSMVCRMGSVKIQANAEKTALLLYAVIRSLILEKIVIGGLEMVLRTVFALQIALSFVETESLRLLPRFATTPLEGA